MYVNKIPLIIVGIYFFAFLKNQFIYMYFAINNNITYEQMSREKIQKYFF